MLTLTLRVGESVCVGGKLGETLRVGDEEVTFTFTVRERDRIKVSIDAPGKIIQRSVNLKSDG